jgi:hypothetical protein
MKLSNFNAGPKSIENPLSKCKEMPMLWLILVAYSTGKQATLSLIGIATHGYFTAFRDGRSSVLVDNFLAIQVL